MTDLHLSHEPLKKPDVLVVPVREDKGKAHCLGGDEAVQKAVHTLEASGAFKPTPGASYLLTPLEGQRILLFGLGDKDAAKKAGLSRSEALRRLGGKLFKALSGLGKITAELHLDPIEEEDETNSSHIAECLAIGARLANYSYDTHKGKSEHKKKESKKSLNLHLSGKGAKAGLAKAQAISDAVLACRDLQATPPNIADPHYMSGRARAIAKTHKHVKATILGEAELKKAGYVGILTVGAGSIKESQLIVVDYNPPGAKGTLGLVGKAITFDTGGISLKPGAKMHEMKYDKSGGCAVLNAIDLIASLEIPHRVVAVVTAAENMPGGRAARPGDIITYKNGKSVEILNTDAEGRLVLADGLLHIASFKPDVVLDLATLTGMCVATFGHVAAGVMSNNDALSEALIASGKESGERLWPLPMWEEYGEMIKGEHADIKNIGGQYGGTITGAWFLKHFVPEGTPWAHLDIAGTAWGDFKNSYIPNGPSGFGVRLLLDFLEQQGKHLNRFKKEMA